MSIRIDAAGERLSRTVGLPLITRFTMMCWGMRIGAGSGAWESIMHFGDSGEMYSLVVVYGSGGSGSAWGIDNFGGGGADPSGGNLTDNVWFHFAMTCSGTGTGAVLGYRNAILEATLNGNTLAAASFMGVGDNSHTEWGNCRIAAVKVWGAVLNQHEIQMEMMQYAPARTRDLNSFYPFIHDFYARGPARGGLDLTVAGTPTREDGPPIPWVEMPYRFKRNRVRILPPPTAAPALFDPVMVERGMFDDHTPVDALFDWELGRNPAGGQLLTVDLSDGITLGDSRVSMPGKALSDALAVADAIVLLTGLNKSDAITVADAIEKLTGKSLSDSMTLSDAIQHLFGLVKSDSITLGDAINLVIILVKDLSDSIALADAIIKSAGKNLADTISLTDTLTNAVAIAKSDSITLADAIVKQANKNLRDGVTLSDNVAASLVIIKDIADSITLTDTIVKMAGKNLTDAITFTDVVTKSAQLVKTDSITLGEAITRTVGKVLADGVTLSDSISAALVILKSLSDSFTVTDTVAKMAGKVLTDAISFTDAVVKRPGLVRTDALVFTDAARFDAIKVISNTIVLADAVTAFIIGAGPLFIINMAGAIRESTSSPVVQRGTSDPVIKEGTSQPSAK